MTITAEVTSHTKWKHWELITLRLRYPRKIHAQLLTHRSFSRNAMSSRAMRIEDMIAEVWRDPATIETTLHGSGMQPSDRAPDPTDAAHVMHRWRNLLEHTIGFVQLLDDLKWAKEEANRFLEPFAHITTVVTMTPQALDHFCGLRNMKAGAQKAIDVLARAMRDAYEASTPMEDPLHIPFRRSPESPGKWEDIAEQVAFAARVSFDKDARDYTQVDNLRLAQRLWNANPKHASPMEHVCLLDTSRATIAVPNNFYLHDTLQLRHYGEVVMPDATLQKACDALRLAADLARAPVPLCQQTKDDHNEDGED